MARNSEFNEDVTRHQLDEIPQVDREFNLYELTDIFYAFYQYHNNSCYLTYDEFDFDKRGNLQTTSKTLSRFDAARRLEASKLGSRPFMGGKGTASHKANLPLNYMKQSMNFMRLPYRATFNDSEFAKIKIDQRLFNENTLTKQEKEDLSVQAANNPNLASNDEISTDVSSSFNGVLKISKAYEKAHAEIALRVPQDGAVGVLHNDVDYTIEAIPIIDLVTEPQAAWDTTTWCSFFIIRTMTCAEIREKIKNPGKFWNEAALRWAMLDASDGQSLLSGNNSYFYRDIDDTASLQGESFHVKSFYKEKSGTRNNVNSFYGNVTVVEGYYKNKNGKVDKVIFFPSYSCCSYSKDSPNEIKEISDEQKTKLKNSGADILFYKEGAYDSIDKAMTVIPIDRGERSFERQRGYGHELFSSIETLGRIDSAIINTIILMSIPFTKDVAQGTNAQDLKDIEINLNQVMVNMGEREFIENPFKADLQAMIGVRQLLLQHVASLMFLGGLDGQQTAGNHTAHHMAGLRLVRDGRHHKENIEDFAKGMREVYLKALSKILSFYDSKEIRNTLVDPLLNKKFFSQILDVYKHPKEIFEFKKEDIIADTYLPYYINLEVIRNGGSHFGAAEMVLYSEAMQTFGNGMSQQAIQNITRMGIKSIFGSEDALDILGDPAKNIVDRDDHIYRALFENTGILGSVDNGVASFEPLPVRVDKDDHVVHLTDAHLPKMEELIQRLQSGEVSLSQLEDMTETELETRNNLTLKLGALANHARQHLDQLDRFGQDRDDINELKERTNFAIQSAEGLLNRLQQNLRALQAKREQTRLRLQNLSPENEAERLKAENELKKISLQEEKQQIDLALANALSEQRQKQHLDKQVSKARDRRQKEIESQRNFALELQKMAQPQNKENVGGSD